MTVYISTSDKYVHLLKPFSFLFNRFWSETQPVVVLGYKEPDFDLPDNFSFVSMGVSRNDPQEWSTGLREYFSSIDDEWFIYGTEDMFLVQAVNLESLTQLTQYMERPDVGRISLTNDGMMKDCTVVDGNLIELTQDTDYRLSCIYSAWNREYMLRYLQPEMSPWEFEVKGTEQAKNDGYRILGMNNNFPIYLSLAIRRGNFDSLDFRVDNEYHRSLDRSIIDEMVAEGLI
jgi:hypothetical protein|tara:strand:- start:51 stop:743 length:693 start_codon:yes stop_codon:yes gene_type:complete